MSNEEKYTLEKATKHVYRGPVENNTVEEIQCNSWGDFQKKVKFTDRPFGDRVFRGQSNENWGLASKWDRYRIQKENVLPGKTASEGRNETPESFLEAFKDNYIGNANFDTSKLNDEQWMALGRHHGLITPLLDWTRSPYVAAYFAYKKYLPKDKELGCLNPMPVDHKDGNIAVWEIPLRSVLQNFDEFQIVRSMYDAAYRQKAQSGLFTLLDPQTNLTIEVYLKNKNYQHILKKYLIPIKEVVIAMHDLHLMNINECTLFPDADGAAYQANIGSYLDWASLLQQLK